MDGPPRLPITDAQNIMPFPAQPRAERRLAGRVVDHWIRLGGEQSIPSLSQYEKCALPFSRANLFVIRMDPRGWDDRIVRAGAAFRNALGLDPVGRLAADVLPSAREHGLSYHRTAVERRRPIADVGRFSNTEGAETLYRCILLPLSENQKQVDHVLGAFSHRPFE